MVKCTADGEQELTERTRVLTVQQAAAALGISTRTVRRAIRSGDLRATKRRGMFRIASEDLAHYQEVQAAHLRPLPRLLRLVPSQPEPATANCLPTPATRLIGRQREVAAVLDLLHSPDDPRLVVLTGPGGVGKSRLAVEVAAAAADAFTDGLAFISLAPIRDPALVAVTIAKAIGVREARDKTLVSQIGAQLATKHQLLVLDNFEHLMEAGALTGELLATCSRLTMLVTSRERLRLSGEHVFPVLPLTVPGVEESRSRGVEKGPTWNGGRRKAEGGRREIEDSAAVQLFVARARAVDPGFVLTQENALVVAEICRRLDGLPLAIELAAARSAVLPPAALLGRLDRRLPLLTGGPRDVPARQRTLRDAIAWSYELLTPEERALFRRLAMFVGGFTLEAAEHVGGSLRSREEEGGRCAPLLGLDLVTSLVDKSLLQRTADSDAAPRFVMLETIREYGLEQLHAHGETSAAQQRHAAYYLSYAETTAAKLRGREQAAHLERLEAEHDNLRAAMAWSLGAPGRVGTALRLVGALHWFWYLSGHSSEGRRWLEAALTQSAAKTSTPVRLAVLTSEGFPASYQDDNSVVRDRLRESIALGRALRDVPGVAYALDSLGLGDFFQVGSGELRPLVEECITLLREADDQLGLATSLCTLGMVAIVNLEPDAAVAPLVEGLAISRALGDPWALARALLYSGELARLRGNDEQARQFYEESLSLYRALDHKGMAAIVAHNLGYIAQRQGNLRHGLACFAEALAEHVMSGDRHNVACCVGGIAGMAAFLGRQEQAARLFGAADDIFASTGSSIWPIDKVDYERNLGAVRADLSEEAFTSAYAAGQALTLEEAVAEASAVHAADTAASTASALGLTQREREILELLSRRATDVEIADLLSISPRTVMHHVSHILAKLGATNRREAAAWATSQGIA
jgi:excisionase family DNA binding protein